MEKNIVALEISCAHCKSLDGVQFKLAEAVTLREAEDIMHEAWEDHMRRCHPAELEEDP